MLDWQQRRNQINHDWLKNRYLPALEKLLHLLDDHLEDSAFEHDFVATVLPAWKLHCPEVLSLPADFEKSMSPRRHFEHPPLSLLDDETRHWLGEVIHFLWLARYPVREWVEEAAARAQAADAAYGEVSAGLKGCPDPRSVSALRPLRELFRRFLTACQQLARAIESFPREVRVT